MRRAERVALVKAVLARSIEAAKANGWAIVCEIDMVDRDDGVSGCCALASLDAARSDERVPFSEDDDEMARERDSIELGFDGVDPDPRGTRCQDGQPVVAYFFEVGQELRRVYRPITCTAFLASQVAREEARAGSLLRFT